jgi:osmotically-inducible protein OsmY
MSTGVARRLAEKAEQIVRDRLDLVAGRQVFCENHDGVLLLRGRVSSFYEKQLAQEAVRKLEGVDQIVNQIEVVPTT